MEKCNGAFFLDWAGAFQAGVEAAGGKGWNLGRLERYGFKVPAGGVLAAGAYRVFIEKNNLLEDMEKIIRIVTAGNIGDKEIEQKLFLLREKIKAGRIPSNVRDALEFSLSTAGMLAKPVAVRSSATAEDSGKASFAGIHESFLNVRGLDNILSAMKECYASLWTPRAVAYRRKMNVKDDEVNQAVVIMEMVEAEAAGVGFTCDPRTGQEDMVLISANFGLGESVVSGAVEPDEYRLDYWCEITQKKISGKEGMTVPGKDGGTEFVKSAGLAASQVLSDENIRRLGLLLRRVFDSLGSGEQHQDIEWAFDGKDFALVQARPVTVLPRYTLDGFKNQPDVWTNMNMREIMPMVQSTLNWSLKKQLLNTLFSAPFETMGYEVPPGLQLVRLYQGRAYLGGNILGWLMYDALGIDGRGMVALEKYDSFGAAPELEINEKKPYRGIKGCKRLGRLLKGALRIQKVRKNLKKYFDDVDDFTKSLLKEDLKSLAEKDLIRKIAEIRSVSTEFIPAYIFGSVEVRFSFIKTLERYFPGKGQAMVNALMAGGGDITSAQHGYRLVEMAEVARGDTAARKFFSSENYNPLSWERELPQESPFKQSLRKFLAEYGHRGIYEMDIINPRWREDPTYLLNTIRSTLETADLSKIKAQQKERADEAWREVNRRIPSYRRGSIGKLLKQALKSAERKEMGKSFFVKIFESERILLQEIGRRLAVRGILSEPADIYHCACSEIFSILQGDWDGRELDVLVAERKARRKELEELSPPDFIVDEAPHFAEPASCGPGNGLTGLGVAAGRASGEAKLIYHPDEGEKLQAGDVLVAPSTDPGWTPLFLRASAIVMEAGSSLCHGSIVAREYGIPAVVNIPGVMKIIKDAQSITVDGDEGKVYL